MSLITQYADLEEQRRKIQAQMAELEASPTMKKELEFKKDLEALLDKHAKSAEDVVEFLKPSHYKKAATTSNRKPRQLKIYKNPHTGAVVETYGGNNKELRQWKEDHGLEDVKVWMVSPENNLAKYEAEMMGQGEGAETATEEAQEPEAKKATQKKAGK